MFLSWMRWLTTFFFGDTFAGVFRSSANRMVGWGTTVPTGAGYSTNAFFIKVNATNTITAIYINNGTNTVANFKPLNNWTGAAATLTIKSATAAALTILDDAGTPKSYLKIDTDTPLVTFLQNISLLTGMTFAIADADKLTVGGNIIPNQFYVAFRLNAASVDGWEWIAPRACKLLAINEAHSTASTSGTLALRKAAVAGTDAPGGTIGATLLALIATDGTINLAATANVNQTPTVATANSGADVTFAAGDRLGVKIGGTMTNLVGACVTLSFKAV